jgi:hypothetical protein
MKCVLAEPSPPGVKISPVLLEFGRQFPEKMAPTLEIETGWVLKAGFPVCPFQA